MDQNDKDLILRDLSARLPYGVHVEISWEYSKTYVHTGLEYYEFPNIDSLLNIFWDEKCISIKPYLRPMSSITKEEYEELKSISSYYGFAPYEYIDDWCPNYEMIDWLNKHHFDYRNLIEKGLALEAPEGMYRNV